MEKKKFKNVEKKSEEAKTKQGKEENEIRIKERTLCINIQILDSGEKNSCYWWN